MENLSKITLIGLFFGTIGTTLGGIIGITFNKTSNKILSFVLSLAAGLMTSIICFDLIPNSLEIGSLYITFIGVILGVITMIYCDYIVEKKMSVKKLSTMNNLLKTGIIVSIGLAIHNIPEGIAIRKRI